VILQRVKLRIDVQGRVKLKSVLENSNCIPPMHVINSMWFCLTRMYVFALLNDSFIVEGMSLFKL
jgi:hypothetical protein